ncbi:MAG: hypothetical protein ACOCYX_05105, partial [Spirochaetota bacterium]
GIHVLAERSGEPLGRLSDRARRTHPRARVLRQRLRSEILERSRLVRPRGRRSGTRLTGGRTKLRLAAFLAGVTVGRGVTIAAASAALAPTAS